MIYEGSFEKHDRKGPKNNHDRMCESSIEKKKRKVRVTKLNLSKKLSM